MTEPSEQADTPIGRWAERTARRLRRGIVIGAVAALVFVVLSGIWGMVRSSPLASRLSVFGGRGLDGGVDGTLAVTVTGEGPGGTVHVVDATGGDPIEIVDTLSGMAVAGWRPDGTAVAYSANVGDRRVLRVQPVSGNGARGPRASGNPVDLATASADVNQFAQPAWSPDGTQVAFIAALPDPDDELGQTISAVWVVPADGGTLVRLGPAVVDRQQCDERIRDGECLADTTGDARHIVWRGDGRAVVATSEIMGTTVNGDVEDAPEETADLTQVVSLPLAGGQPEVLAEVDGPLDQVAVSPEGRYLLYGLSTAETFVLDTVSGTREELGRTVTAPTWSADGERIVFVDGGNVMASHADGTHRARVTRIVTVPDASQVGIGPRRAVWSPDGRHAAAVGDDGTIYVMNADGTGQTEVAAFDGTVTDLRWLPSPGG